MNEELKVKFLQSCGWFMMNNKWHHPNLIKEMDLQSAFLYESFKQEDEINQSREEKLFDSEVDF